MKRYYLLGNPKMWQILRGKWTSLHTNKKIIANQPTNYKKLLISLKGLIEKNELNSVIDRTYALEQIPLAHSYVESGKKIGHVVIKVISE